MCGIVGYFHPQKEIEDLRPLYRAAELIRHRGPDDEGYACFNLKTGQRSSWIGPDSPSSLQAAMSPIRQNPCFAHHLAFGFRRFSIVDLTEKGHQPFWNRDRSVCLIFNGEIYNYVEIRRELEKQGYLFETTCDTEVLMAAYLTWGIDCLQSFNGPIAVVLYDENKQSLFLARDRIGKSPLYYTVSDGALYWASDIKPILELAGRSCFKINEQAVYDYLRYGWRDLDNTTFWKGVFTLPAACYTCLPVGKTPDFNLIEKTTIRYWDFPSSRLSAEQISFADARQQFRDLFLDAVRIRARADAPVAFSLSGGLDSSSVVSAAAGPLQEQITVYAVSFPGHPNDEEPMARRVYRKYQDRIDYRPYTPGNLDFWKTANEFIWLQEEPFHFASSQLYQAVLRQARRDGCKAVINGVGGDELLAGYPHYFFPLLVHLRKHKRFRHLVENLFLKRDLYKEYYFRRRVRNLRAILTGHVDSLGFSPSFFNFRGAEQIQPFLKLETFQGVIQRSGISRDFHSLSIDFFSQWLMNYWLRNYNRMHFGVPMEPRSPLLDYRLVDLCLSLPPEYLIHRGWTKYLLRRALQSEMPRKIVWNRIKKGFQFNTDVWFKEARPIIQTVLDQARDNPFLDTESLFKQYDSLLHVNRNALWRGVNLALWWIRVVQNQPLPGL